MTATRLSPEHWIAAGFEALHATGPVALAAEPLARQIGATKGSFYWHFKDVRAYHVALLRRWQADALADIMRLLASDGPADQRLRKFGHSVLSSPVEPALRLWAQNMPLVRETLDEVDTERLHYIENLLRQIGLGNPDFARALLASLVGLPQIGGDGATAFDTLVDTIKALA